MLGRVTIMVKKEQSCEKVNEGEWEENARVGQV